MFAQINEGIKIIDGWVWGLPLIVLILVTGIYLTCRLGLLQMRHLPRALRYMVKNEEGGEGEVTSFGALCTALSATIGTGNIAGVATALVTGGPGALFWMWLAAFFGMATKYAEGLLAVYYRTVDKDGHALGGPFYYIERGMGKKWKWLACLFAFFGMCVGLFGIGTFTQVNSIATAVTNLFDPNAVHTVSLFGNDYSYATIVAGVLLTICVALVLLGGIRRIASVSQVIVPFMAVLYIVFCLILLVYNYKSIPGALVQIVKGAFNPAAVTGGAVGSLTVAMQKGIARGIFSNEAGLGSAPIAAAAAQTKEPVRQGLVSMTGTFIDTIIICTMTGLTIVITGAWNVPGLDGALVTSYAFDNGLPFLPGWVTSGVLMLCLVFFAFTTILGWDYYGERCLEYLSGGSRRSILVYRWLYILAVFIGPYMTIEAVWNIADIFNGLMALPNLIALLSLSGVIVRETRSYFDRLRSGDLNEQSRRAMNK
ncbi:alanine/glycine:cation symporter family protein [Butyricicoccus porcorum]|uniref:Sodium:alanine symporter family protein n=1 Tax=Butyricicoccus porcorum TaxID=1945634 RepID=A0A252F6G5_9FIRM|nr:sodium:alanine symporter family protein [Butyricicoccus porcorum]MCI6926722.1 sodium:alanine symporter family protein [Butyricicoccus porcorum]MDD6985831.1 sodium:alanine symporter family protein [Butyricicoccus porcorum]MDY4484229.1 sodium:alanine symporter family protein [Butyricicoccus porcorum]OUM21346.1 sodium:alanine symporter family protein [Butyricicoccus porcorum]